MFYIIDLNLVYPTREGKQTYWRLCIVSPLPIAQTSHNVGKNSKEENGQAPTIHKKTKQKGQKLTKQKSKTQPWTPLMLTTKIP